MEKKNRHYPNFPGVPGWIYGGNLNFERILFLLHRLTGLALIFYLFAHIIVVGFRAYSPEMWEAVMGKMSGEVNPVIKFFEWLLVVTVIFHMFNGLRLIVLELGFLIGRPQRPVYPYKTSIDRQRIFTWIMMILASIVIVWSIFAFFMGGGSHA